MVQSTLLCESLHPDHIAVHCNISSRKKLLETMAQLLSKNLDSECKEKDIYLHLWEREKLGNTGVGNGIAIPHARCHYAESAVVAIITLEAGVDYDAADKQAVDLAFGLLVPEQANQEHLNLLASIAQLMSDTNKKQALLDAATSAEVISLIQSWCSGSKDN